LEELRPNEETLIDILERARHTTPSEWLFLRELRVGTGRQSNGAQRLDGFALNTLPHTAMKRVCYEVKTSRADFLAILFRKAGRQQLRRRQGWTGCRGRWAVGIGTPHSQSRRFGGKAPTCVVDVESSAGHWQLLIAVCLRKLAARCL
jgi:hypothetical protein